MAGPAAAAAEAGAAGEEPDATALLARKVKELEAAAATAGSSPAADEELAALAKARKKQQKELAALVDSADATKDEKMKALHARCIAQAQELRQLEKEGVLAKRRNDATQRELEAERADKRKVLAIKETLEKLCRELQVHNKQLVEESKAQSSAEEGRRQELVGKFDTVIKDVSEKLEAHEKERGALATDNDTLRDHLQKLANQLSLTEQMHEKEKKASALQKELLEARLAESTKVAEEQRAQMEAFLEQAKERTEREKEQQAQILHYSEQFASIQELMAQSQEAFTTYRAEQDRQSKVIKKLNKENDELRSKAAKSDVVMIDLHEQNAEMTKQLKKLSAQKEKLENLCRALSEKAKPKPPEPKDVD